MAFSPYRDSFYLRNEPKRYGILSSMPLTFNADDAAKQVALDFGGTCNGVEVREPKPAGNAAEKRAGAEATAMKVHAD